MKKLSDYKDEEAIELWADLLEPIGEILGDEEIAEVVRAKKSKMIIAKTILKSHPKETESVLLRIDPEPLNGVNIILRLMEIITDIGKNEELKSFFGYAEQEKEETSSGSVMENTEDDEK